jgi:hypothetical protein
MIGFFIYAVANSEVLAVLVFLGIIVMFFMKNGFGLLAAIGFMSAIFAGAYALVDNSIYNFKLFAIDIALSIGFMFIQNYIVKKDKELADKEGREYEEF